MSATTVLVAKTKSGYTYVERFRGSRLEDIKDKVEFALECGIPVLLETIVEKPNDNGSSGTHQENNLGASEGETPDAGRGRDARPDSDGSADRLQTANPPPRTNPRHGAK